MRWFATLMKLLFEQYKHLKLQPLKKITDTDFPYQSIVDTGITTPLKIIFIILLYQKDYQLINQFHIGAL